MICCYHVWDLEHWSVYFDEINVIIPSYENSSCLADVIALLFDVYVDKEKGMGREHVTRIYNIITELRKKSKETKKFLFNFLELY